MIFLKKFILLLTFLPFAYPHSSEIIYPTPLILEYPDNNLSQLKEFTKEEVQFQCTSWRVAVEANNLSPWKRIPEECLDYVKDYMTGVGYEIDLERVSIEARLYASTLNLSGDRKDVWIFDIDETLLSNLPYYAAHGHGSETFDSTKFDKWVETGMAPPIESSLELYEEVLSLGFRIILLTGRSERHRSITVQNLLNAGFREWDRLILRSPEDHVKTATIFKSEKRNELVEEGFRILGNSGDQWSDLLGTSLSQRSFKLSNPMYYIS